MTTTTTLTTTTTTRTTITTPVHLQNSTQVLAPVNSVSGQVRLAGNGQDLLPINQAFEQLTVEGLRNQEKILDNIALLFNAVKFLDARNQVLTDENLILKERLKRCEARQEDGLTREFNHFVNVTNVTIQGLTTRIDGLRTELDTVRREKNALNDRFDKHYHIASSHPSFPRNVPTSGPHVSPQ